MNALASEYGSRARFSAKGRPARAAAIAPHAVPHDFGEQRRTSLLAYWRTLSVVPAADRLARLRAVDAAGTSAWNADLWQWALPALADCDDEVVFVAASRYLAAAHRDLEGTDAAISHALQWIGRRLALRPESVFAAMLARHCETLRDQLRSVRSTSCRGTVFNLLVRFSDAVDVNTTAFLDEWRLLELATARPEPKKNR